MTGGQSKLGDWSDDEDLEESNVEGTHTRFHIAMREAPDDAEPFVDDSCPWCLAPSDRFKWSMDDDGPGRLPKNPLVSCGECGAAIPTEAEWYKNGEKVCY